MADPNSVIAIPGLAASPNPSIVTRLAGGSIFPVGAGNWIFRLGANCAAQWYDINSGLWHVLESGIDGLIELIASDGTNYRIINLSGTIQGANITVAGTLYTQANTTISFAAPAAGITATGTPIIGGSLTYTVTAAGSGYTNPQIIIPNPWLLGGTAGLSIPATATVSTSAGALGSVTSGFAGAGYVNAPAANTQTLTPAQFAANPNYWLSLGALILIDPAGTGGIITPALANGTATNGGLTGIIITNPGSGYDGTHIPAVTITSTTGINAAATALPNLALTSVTVGGTNTGYTASVVGLTSLGSGTALSSINGEPAPARPGRFVAAQSGGALGTPVIEDAGGGFQTVPLAKQVGNATADGSVNATFTAVVGGVNNTLLGWQIG